MRSDLTSKLHKAISEGLSWVVWRLPNDSGWHQAGPAREKVWKGEPVESESFVFAPFNTQNHPGFIIGEPGTHLLEPLIFNQPVISSKMAYLNWVKKSISAIQNGEYTKVVGARVHKEHRENFDPVTHYIALCEEHKNAFCYMWYSPSTGLWMGASPELLLERNANQIRTMALAGTRAEANAVFGNKEEEEQGLVLKYLEEALHPWLAEMYIEEISRSNSGHLSHLKNELKGVLRNINPNMTDLIYSLHPTPAVAGLPKVKAIQFIEQEEGFDRSYYSGFLGTLSANKAGLYVNLRCMHVIHDTLYVYIGAGLTAHSNPEMEWEETEEKSKVVLLN